MSKKNIIFSTILLFAFVSVCYLSVSSVKTSVEVDDEQDDISISILSTPKSSGYKVTERWNYSSTFEVTAVAVSADGKYMAATAYGPTRGGNPSHQLFFFNTSDHDGIPLWSIPSSAYPDSLAISADGEYIVVGSSDGWAFLFNSTGDLVWEFDFSEFGPIYSVDISADGELIVVGGFDYDYGAGVVFLLDNLYYAVNKLNEFLWYCDLDGAVFSVAISADGKYVAAGTEYIELRDVESWHQVFFFNTTDYTFNDFQMPMWSFDTDIGYGSASIDSLAISADGEYIAAGSTDGIAFLFNKSIPVGQKDPVWYVYFDGYPIPAVDISADGRYIVTGVDVEGNGAVVLLNNKKPTLGVDKSDELSWFCELAGIVNSVSITADGRYIVAGTEKYIPPRAADPYDTVFLFKNSGYTYGEEHVPEWSFNTSYDVNSVSISAWGNHFAAGGIGPTSGRTYLFYHARPLPLGLPRPDDDDDDDEAAAIPFGNYYLIFAALAVIALIIIYKRKTILSKK